MKLSKMLLAGAIVVVLCLSFGYRQGVAAGEKQIAPARIAVVDVTKVLQNSKKHKACHEKLTAEETVIKAEFQKDKKALEALQAGMDVLKAGSKDYVDAMKDFLDKKGLLEA